MNEYVNKHIERKKVDNLKYYKLDKLNDNENLHSPKSEYQIKIQKAKNDLSALIKEEASANTIRNNNTHDLILYIQNIYSNNNYNTDMRNTSNNSKGKNNGKNMKYNYKKNNYLDNASLNLGVNTVSNNANNKRKQNKKLLIDINNSYSKDDIDKNFENKTTKEKDNKINIKTNDNDIEYSNTEANNFSSNSNYFIKNDKILSEQKDVNIDYFKKNKPILNKLYKKKSNSNKLIINVSNNNLYNTSNIKYPNNKTSSNSINNYFKLKNMNLQFLNEGHPTPTEINVLTNHNNNQDDSFKKLKLNISSDLLFKQKIKNDLDPIKKNKELSQQLENTSKELDKMHNIRQKYLTSINKNINIKKEFKDIKRKNETYSRDLENKDKEIMEQKNLIDKLYKEVISKNKYIKEIKENLNKKEELINILNNQIQNLKGKYTQLSNENNILYKFKELYDENASKNIKLENNINKFMDINNKYISLQQNYNKLESNYNRLFDIEIKYENLKKENSLLKELEKNYKEMCNKYNEAEENNIEFKDLKIKYDLIYSENKNLVNVKNKFEKIYPEYLELKEIRNKYDDILKEQKNLIMIENKYNDLIQEIQELKTIKIKYDELMEEKFKEKKESFNIINKMKSQLNEAFKQNIILKNQFDLKTKENEKLEYIINEYKIKYEKI